MANTTGKKFGGRHLGTPNKLSLTVKENVIEVFDRLGGVDTMVEWANRYQSEFYKLYCKLLPQSGSLEISQTKTYEDYLEELPPPPRRRTEHDEIEEDVLVSEQELQDTTN